MAGYFLRDARGFDAWQTRQREYAHQLVREAREQLIEQYTRAGDGRGAIEQARALLALDPLGEAAARRLMELLAQHGRRSEALQQYERTRQLLDDELAVEPAPETTAVYEQILAGAWEPIAELVRPDRVPNNLPRDRTPFVGRDKELVQLGEQLAGADTRLITILGAGGSGKTRMGIATARAQLGENGTPSRFVDGVYFVELAAVEEPEALVATMMAAMDLSLPDGMELQPFINYLRNKRMLFVLDNFEQLLPAARIVNQICDEAPGVKLIVTSRERLNSQHEWLFPLAGLDFPPAGRPLPDLLELRGFGSVQLFAHIAQQLQPGFRVRGQNAAAIARISQLVQGMPLGLVLAASWLELLAPDEVVAEMAHSFDMLESDIADLPARQQSLRAAFDYSWRLLTPPLQRAFCQLSVFRGGFTYAAAREIAGVTLTELRKLAHKSMIYRDDRNRYEVHELMRQFAAEKLSADRGLETAVREAHSRYYLSWLADQKPRLQSGEQELALDEIDPEANNILVAWQWGAEQQRAARLHRALASLDLYAEWHFAVDALLAPAVRMAVSQFEGAQTITGRRLFALLLTYDMWDDRFDEDPDAQRTLAERGLAIVEELEAEGIDVTVDKIRALSAVADIDNARNLQLREQCVKLARRSGDRWLLAITSKDAGWAYQWRADFGACEPHFRRAIAIFDALGDRRAQSQALEGLPELGAMFDYLEKLPEYEALARRNMELNLAIGDHYPKGLRNLQFVYWQQGRYEEGIQLAEQAKEIHRRLRNEGKTTVSCNPIFVFCYIYTGQYDVARELLAEALETWGGSASWAGQFVAGMLGEIYLAEGDRAAALASFAEHERHCRKNHNDIDLLGFAPAYAAAQNTHAAFAALIRDYNSFQFAGNYQRVIPMVASYFLDAGDVLFAAELYALALRYDAVRNGRWYADVVGDRLATAVAQLPPEAAEEARRRGQARDLFDTIDELAALFGVED